MIMNFLKKVPAGMMIVPLLIGAVSLYAWEPRCSWAISEGC